MIRRPPRSPLFPYTTLSRSLVHRRRDRVRRIFQRRDQLRLVVQLAATIGGNEILGEQPAEWCRIPPHDRSSPLVLQAAQRLLHAALGKNGRRGGEQEGRHQLKLSHWVRTDGRTFTPGRRLP